MYGLPIIASVVLKLQVFVSSLSHTQLYNSEIISARISCLCQIAVWEQCVQMLKPMKEVLCGGIALGLNLVGRGRYNVLGFSCCTALSDVQMS